MVVKELQWFQEENYYIVSPHSPRSGGLFLYWKKEIDLAVLSSTQNYVDTTITSKRDLLHSNFVYGKHDHSKKGSTME